MSEQSSSPIDLEGRPFVVDLRHDAVIACAGELDIAAVSDLRDAIAAAAPQRPERVVLDLAKVTFLDCSALGEIDRADSVLRDKGGELWIRGLTPAARRVVVLAGIDLSDEPAAESIVPAVGRNHPERAVDDIVVAWRAASRTSPGVSGALVVPDPSALVSRIVSGVYEFGRTVRPRTLAEISQTYASSEVAANAIVDRSLDARDLAVVS